MRIEIHQLFQPDELQTLRQQLEQAHWRDGRETAGTLATAIKHNEQLDDADPLAQQLGQQIISRLASHPTFIAAALPRRLYPPKFNRYRDQGHYGAHVDSAVMPLPGSGELLRSDLSATLFLAEPDSYDGGELCIEEAFGEQQVKLPAGSLVLYPSNSLHRVKPVTRGARIAAFFWIQSLVADPVDRRLLYELDLSIQGITPSCPPDDPDLLRLTGVYHNLLRRWANP